MLDFVVSGQELKRVDSKMIVSDTIDYITARFRFSGDWAGLTKHALFEKGTDTYDITLTDNAITESDSCNLTDGTWLLSVVGVEIVDAVVTQRITTQQIELSVTASGNTSGEPFPQSSGSDLYLTLNQTTPQTIIDGVPLLASDRTINADNQLADKKYVDDKFATVTADDFNHNDLANKQGGTTNEFYHVTAAEKTVIQNTSGMNTGDQVLPTRDSLGLDTDDNVTFANLSGTNTGDQDVTGAISTHNASATAHANQIAPLITNHNWLYDGRDLSTIFTVEQLIAAVRAADWTNIRIGDYWPITLNGTFRDRGYYTCPTSTNYYSDTGLTSLVGQTLMAYQATYIDSTYCSITISGTTYYVSTAACTAYYERTLSNAVFKMEVAGIDTYYNYGDTAVPHHIDFISRDCMAWSLPYNTTTTNSGAFIGSALFTTLNDSTNGLVKLLPADLAAVIIQKRGMTETKTGTTASGWAWNDMGKLWLPTEREVWGQDIRSEHSFGGGLAIQYPIFKDSLRHIIKGVGNGGGRCGWWCASSAAGSAATFCFVYSTGIPTSASAISAYVLVPLCFRIA